MRPPPAISPDIYAWKRRPMKHGVLAAPFGPYQQQGLIAFLSRAGLISLVRYSRFGWSWSLKAPLPLYSIQTIPIDGNNQENHRSQIWQWPPQLITVCVWIGWSRDHVSEKRIDGHYQWVWRPVVSQSDKPPKGQLRDLQRCLTLWTFRPPSFQ